MDQDQIRKVGGAAVIRVDEQDCAALWGLAEPLLEEEDVTGFVLDCSNVEYLNSMNIAAIIALRSRLEKRGVRLALANLREQVVSIFRVLKLERLFALDHDLDRAVEAVSA